MENQCRILADKGQYEFLQIGDGFYIVADFSCVNEMCSILAELQWKVLIQNQELIRGCLTAGNVSIDKDKNFFIGQAVVEAFELERKNAIFPRIIYENKKIEGYIGKGIVDYKYIVDDEDKIKYVNYIQYNIDKDKLNKNKLEKLLVEKEIIEILKTGYEKQITKNKAIAQKYGWLISKLEAHKIKIF